MNYFILGLMFFVCPAYSTTNSSYTIDFIYKEHYVFIKAEVDGKTGYLMIDNGTEPLIFLNNHYLSLKQDLFITNGKAQSGQNFLVYQQKKIDQLDIDQQINLLNLASVMHANFSFIEEGIEPQFLGFLGYGFLKNYRFRLNYQDSTLSLFGKEMPTLLKAPVVTFIFKNKTAQKIPDVNLQIAQENITAHIDIGGGGILEITHSLKEKLEKKSNLKKMPNPKNDGQLYQLTSLTYQGFQFPELDNVRVKESRENHIWLGGDFLKNYLSEWDYVQGRIYLYAP
jgi:hypothetical protein